MLRTRIVLELDHMGWKKMAVFYIYMWIFEQLSYQYKIGQQDKSVHIK